MSMSCLSGYFVSARGSHRKAGRVVIGVDASYSTPVAIIQAQVVGSGGVLLVGIVIDAGE